ncbi:MAG: hypothetical protein ACLSAF_04875 [Intestinimonas sp.]
MKRRLMAMGLLLTWAPAGSSALAAEETEVEVTLNGFGDRVGAPHFAWKEHDGPGGRICRSLGEMSSTASWDSSPARRHPVPLGRGSLRCAHGGMV